MNKTNTNFKHEYIRELVITIAVGAVLIVAYVFVDGHFRLAEYPKLTFSDSLVNERISSFETNHAISYVDFGDGRKHTLDWGQNLNYEDYPTIVSILSIGDIVTKKANSDTITIKHSDKDYFYVLGLLIEKSK